MNNEFQRKVVTSKSICLGVTLINQNYICEEIKNRLNTGNACYYSVQSLLSSHLYETSKIKIHETNFTCCFVL